PAHKDLGRNGQERAIASKATYVPVSKRAGSRSAHHNALTGAEAACKDLKRNGQVRAITLKAAYTPTSMRAGSRSLFSRRDVDA
ncbi:hypothetical protein HMPREF2969_00445, partial [Lactobacillus sp. HMSC056D05]